MIIECYGESTMVGYGLPSGQSIPEILAALMPANTFINYGRASTTAAQMLAGTDGSGSTFKQKMIESTAHTIIVNRGINEANNEVSQDAFRETMMQIVAVAQKYGKIVILQSPNATFTGGPMDTAVDLSACTVKAVAEEFGVPLLFSDGNGISKALVRSNGVDMLYQPGGVHPTLPLYQAMASALTLPIFDPDNPPLIAVDANLLNQLKVAPLYHAAFNRAPDAPGLRYWGAQIALGQTQAQIATTFMGTPTWLDAHNGGQISNQDFVAGLYQNVFDKAPDDNGYWASQMDSGMSRADVMVSFANIELQVIGVI